MPWYFIKKRKVPSSFSKTEQDIFYLDIKWKRISIINITFAVCTYNGGKLYHGFCVCPFLNVLLTWSREMVVSGDRVMKTSKSRYIVMWQTKALILTCIRCSKILNFVLQTALYSRFSHLSHMFFMFDMSVIFSNGCQFCGCRHRKDFRLLRTL